MQITSNPTLLRDTTTKDTRESEERKRSEQELARDRNREEWIEGEGKGGKQRKKKKEKKRRTVDPLALVTAKHVDGLANVGRSTDTLQGAHLGQALVNGLHGHALVAVGDVVPCILVKHVGLDAAGGNSIDRHALFAAVDGKGAGEALDGGLGAGVQGVVGDAADAGGNGRGEDEAAAVAAVLEGVLGDKELAAAVEVEDLVKELRGDVDLGAPDLHARVGNDKVEVAKVRDGLFKQLRDRLGLADVGLDGDALGAQLGELLDDLFGGLGRAAVVDHHAGASLAQLEGDALADAAAGARDQGNLAGKGTGRVNSGAGGGRVECGGCHFVGVWKLCMCLERERATAVWSLAKRIVRMLGILQRDWRQTTRRDGDGGVDGQVKQKKGWFTSRIVERVESLLPAIYIGTDSIHPPLSLFISFPNKHRPQTKVRSRQPRQLRT